MMPSTTLRLSRNGCPWRPELEGSRGSIRSHCSSVNWRNLDFVRAIRTPSRESPLSNGRHALVAQPVATVVVTGDLDGLTPLLVQLTTSLTRPGHEPLLACVALCLDL